MRACPLARRRLPVSTDERRSTEPRAGRGSTRFRRKVLAGATILSVSHAAARRRRLVSLFCRRCGRRRGKGGEQSGLGFAGAATSRWSYPVATARSDGPRRFCDKWAKAQRGSGGVKGWAGLGFRPSSADYAV